MNRILFLFALLLGANTFAQTNSQPNCPAQIIHWDSEGNSPYVIYAECAGPLNAAPSGSTQIVQASTDDAGGVGSALFRCENGTWVIDAHASSNWGAQSTGNCAD